MKTKEDTMGGGNKKMTYRRDVLIPYMKAKERVNAPQIGDVYQNIKTDTITLYFALYTWGWTVMEYDFNPRHGLPSFVSVGYNGIYDWSEYKRIILTSDQKDQIIKTIEGALKSKFRGSEETDILRDKIPLPDALYFIKYIVKGEE